MISTILRIHWIGLCRDRVAQFLSFLLPIAFFSIFALIFGGQKSNSTPAIPIAIADLDHSPTSQRIVRALAAEKSLKRYQPKSKSTNVTEIALNRETAETLVREGTVSVSIVIPKGWGNSFPNWTGEGPQIELLTDVSNPVGSQVVAGMLQKVAMSSAPDLMMKSGIAQFEQFGGSLTEQQRKAVNEWSELLKSDSTNGTASANSVQPAKAGDEVDSFGGLIPTKKVDLLGATKKSPMVAFYAAGIGVMFLLFSCSGAAGSLLEEVEAGTLERLLTTKAGMTKLLIGKWLFLTLFGILQLTLMFTWGALVFKLELIPHLPGFIIMTVFTAAAASALSMLLAAACRSRAQLSGVSTIVILSMSAVGGSMIPRFIMSETMQKLGLFTFNGWALDGYQKVFWRDAPLFDLWPQVLFLFISAILFLSAARILARRWETI